VRPRRLRPDSVSGSADSFRETLAEAAVAEDRLSASHRTAVRRTTRRQDADRDADQGHAAQRWLVQLALHARPVGPEDLGRLVRILRVENGCL